MKGGRRKFVVGKKEGLGIYKDVGSRDGVICVDSEKLRILQKEIAGWEVLDNSIQNKWFPLFLFTPKTTAIKSFFRYIIIKKNEYICLV